MSVPRYTQIEIDALQAMGWTEEKIALHCRAMLQDAMGPDWDEFRMHKERLEREAASMTAEDRQYYEECDGEDFMAYFDEHPFSYYMEVPYLYAEPFLRNGAHVIESRFVQFLPYFRDRRLSFTPERYMDCEAGLPDKAAWKVMLVFDEVGTFSDTMDELSKDAPVFEGDEASAEAYLRWLYDLWTVKEFYAGFGQWFAAAASAMNLLQDNGNEWYRQHKDDLLILVKQTYILNLFFYDWADGEIDSDGGLYTNGGRILKEIAEGYSPDRYSVAPGTQVIDDFVFYDQQSITEISIPESVRVIGIGFLYDPSARNVNYPSTYPHSIYMVDSEIDMKFPGDTYESVHYPKYEKIVDIMYVGVASAADDEDVAEHKRELIRQDIATDYIKEHAEELRSEYDRILLKKAEQESRFDEFLGAKPRVLKEYNDLHNKAFREVPFIDNKESNVTQILGLEEISWFL